MSEKLYEIGLWIAKSFTKEKYFIIYYLMGVIGLSLLWFVAIFLYAPDFYKNNHIAIAIVFSVTMAFVFQVLYIVEAYLRAFLEYDDPPNSNTIYFNAMLGAILYLSNMIFLCRVFRFEALNFDFRYFVLVVVLPVGFNILKYRNKHINKIEKSKKNDTIDK